VLQEAELLAESHLGWYWPRGVGDSDATELRLAEPARGVLRDSVISAPKGDSLVTTAFAEAGTGARPGAKDLTPAASAIRSQLASRLLDDGRGVDAVDAALPPMLARGVLEMTALPAASEKTGGEAPAGVGGARSRGVARGVALLATELPASLPLGVL